MRSIRDWVLFTLSLGWTALAALPAPAQNSVPPTGGYTGATLGEALTNLGYDAKAIDGETDAYLIAVLTGTTSTLYTRVSLSSDLTNIWLRTIVLDLFEPKQANQAAFRRLLEENDRIGPTRFLFSEGDKTLRVSRHVANREMTPVKLRKAFEEYNGAVIKLKPLWRIDNFIRIAGVPDDVVAEGLKPLQGQWRSVEIWNFGTHITEEALKGNAPVRIEANKFSSKNAGGGTDIETIAIDPRTNPGKIDLIGAQDTVTAGLYKLENDTLTLYFAGGSIDRPKDAQMTPSKSTFKLIMKRVPQS